MKEWKFRQEIYHRLTADADRGDEFEDLKVLLEEDEELIVKRALEYPFVQREYLYYPAKSFAIAVIYARLIEKCFDEKIIDLLNDPQLLYGNDPYFKTYDQAPRIYERLLADMPKDFEETDPRWSLDMKQTLKYFKEEFMLDSEKNVICPS